MKTRIMRMRIGMRSDTMVYVDITLKELGGYIKNAVDMNEALGLMKSRLEVIFEDEVDNVYIDVYDTPCSSYIRALVYEDAV